MVGRHSVAQHISSTTAQSGRQPASGKKTIVCTIYMGLKEQDTTYQPAPAKMCSAAAMLKRLAAKPVAWAEK